MKTTATRTAYKPLKLVITTENRDEEDSIRHILAYYAQEGPVEKDRPIAKKIWDTIVIEERLS